MQNIQQRTIPNQEPLGLFYCSSLLSFFGSEIGEKTNHLSNLSQPHFSGQDPLPGLEEIEVAYRNQWQNRRSTEFKLGTSLFSEKQSVVHSLVALLCFAQLILSDDAQVQKLPTKPH